jgi:hypothetical protein
VHLGVSTALAALALSATAFAQPDRQVANQFPDTFQISYASNLSLVDSFVNLSNAGTQNGNDPSGNICVNVYAFDPTEWMLSCCSCLVTPDGLNSLSVQKDVISNSLSWGPTTSVVIRLLATVPTDAAHTQCNPTLPNINNPNFLATGLAAWRTMLVPTVVGQYAAVETPFQPRPLSVSELQKLVLNCGVINTNGSGHGVCRSCRTGGL